MTIIPGGYSLVEFDDDVLFSDPTEIDQLLKAGTGLTPKTPTEEMANGKLAKVIKQMDVSIRSANVENGVGSAYALLKAAELANTNLNFKFHSLLKPVMIDGCESGWADGDYGTITHDSGEKHAGSKSVKCIIDAGALAGSLGVATLAAAVGNTSHVKAMTLWIKGVAAGFAVNSLTIVIGTCVFTFPAVPASATWRRITLTPDDVTHISSTAISLNYTAAGTDLRDETIYIDEIKIEYESIVIKDVITKAEFENNESGKFNALKVTGEGVGVSESDLMTINI